MKLCNQCDRHFYDQEDFCPFCGPEDWKSPAEVIRKVQLGAWLSAAAVSCGDPLVDDGHAHESSSSGGTDGIDSTTGSSTSDSSSSATNSTSSTSSTSSTTNSSTTATTVHTTYETDDYGGSYYAGPSSSSGWNSETDTTPVDTDTTDTDTDTATATDTDTETETETETDDYGGSYYAGPSSSDSGWDDDVTGTGSGSEG